MAQQLAPTGKRILILERGDWLKREASTGDAKAGCLHRQRYVSPDTWYDRNGKGLPARKSTTSSVVPQMYGAAVCRLILLSCGASKRQMTKTMRFSSSSLEL